MYEKMTSRVQRKGQITIPAEMRDKFEIREGDTVVFTDTPDGILISTKELAIMRALDRMGNILREEEVTLDELIESGRVIREQIAREKYGIASDE